jgi:CRISPR system Cascade subunit CasB
VSETGSEILGWWRKNLRPTEDTSAARALRARLRRASAPEEALAEEAVFQLTEPLPWLRSRPNALATLVQVLARVESHQGSRLAAQLGHSAGSDGSRRMSALRFQRLLRTPATDLATALRRALPLADNSCNVARLGQDMLDWDQPERGEQVRIDWCFDYFNATRERAPANSPEESDA